MASAHNGNLSNAVELRNVLELSGAIFHTTSDTETIAYIITKERLKAPSIEDAVSQAMNTLDAGEIFVNGGIGSEFTPHPGLKQSGIGCDKSKWSMEEY